MGEGGVGGQWGSAGVCLRPCNSLIKLVKVLSICIGVFLLKNINFASLKVCVIGKLINFQCESFPKARVRV